MRRTLFLVGDGRVVGRVRPQVVVAVGVAVVCAVGVLALVVPSPVAADPPNPVAHVVAGTGESGSDDGPAASATFDFPSHLAVSPGGSQLFVVDPFNDEIRRVDLVRQQVSTVASVPYPHGIAVLGRQLYVSSVDESGEHSQAWLMANRDDPSLGCQPTTCGNGPDSVKTLDAFGSEVASVGGFYYPTSIVTNGSRQWVLDQSFICEPIVGCGNGGNEVPRLSVIEDGVRKTVKVYGVAERHPIVGMASLGSTLYLCVSGALRAFNMDAAKGQEDLGELHRPDNRPARSFG